MPYDALSFDKSANICTNVILIANVQSNEGQSLKLCCQKSGQPIT